MINDVKKLRLIFANCDIFRFFKIVANSISKKNGKEFTLKTISHYSEKKSNFRIFLILSLQKTNFLFSERFKTMSRSSFHRTTFFSRCYTLSHFICDCNISYKGFKTGGLSGWTGLKYFDGYLDKSCQGWYWKVCAYTFQYKF